MLLLHWVVLVNFATNLATFSVQRPVNLKWRSYCCTDSCTNSVALIVILNLVVLIVALMSDSNSSSSFRLSRFEDALPNRTLYYLHDSETDYYKFI